MADVLKTAPIPKLIKVGPVTYTVHVGGPEWDQAQIREQAAGLLGATDLQHAVIAMTDQIGPGVQRDVLLHEILHAICQVGGNMLDRVDRDDLEENAIRVLCPSLLGVLRENPALVEYLTEP